MWKILVGIIIAIVAIIASVLLYIWITGQGFDPFDMWMLIVAVTFLLAASLVLCGLLVERGFRDRQYGSSNR